MCGTLKGTVTDKQRQSACSQTTSYLKYFVSIEKTKKGTPKLTLHGNGIYLCTYVEDGDRSYLGHHSVSICKFCARPELLPARLWVSGQPFLSLLIFASMAHCIMATFHPVVKTTSLLHSSTAIVCVTSGFIHLSCGRRGLSRRCRGHFPC